MAETAGGMIGDWANAQTWSPLVLAFMAAAATYLWRAIGTTIAAKIDPDSDLFQWIACVAYGLFAGLIARIIVFPVGVLEQSAMIDRLGAMVIGFIIFFLTRRNIFAATFSAAGAFLLVTWLRAGGVL